MESSSLDLSRWRDRPRGIAYRRWVIISTGLRQLLRLRFFRILLGLAWFAGLLIAISGLLFSQSVASGGWLENLATHIGPRAEAVVAAFGAFVVLYPDICVRGLFTFVFWVHSFLGLWLSLFALSVMVPRLITLDRATNALTAYLSRPITSVDYLLGKLGTIAGILALLWTGPLLFGWSFSMLFATDRDFIIYSFAPLLRALLFNGIALVSLSAIALGVSALSRSSRNTIIIWMGLWLVFAFVAAQPHAPEWICRASFTHNLGEVRQEVFRLDSALSDAGSQLPFLDQKVAYNLTQASKRAESTDFSGAFIALAAFCGLSSFVFFRKLRAQ